jgi:hypothetical protein
MRAIHNDFPFIARDKELAALLDFQCLPNQGRTLMQRQRVPSPRNVLPPAEVPQELRMACLPHQDEIIEPQFLEAAPESASILYFPRDEQAPGARRVACKIDVAFLGIVEPR